ncbi:MAG: N-acetyltransferase [Sphingobacteriales bacterium]|nr:N-acetyltransferase [Sphingobacteriales bacterium]
MEIQHFEKNNKGLFYIREDGKRLAEMTYSRASESLIIIDHTDVSETLKGKGAGLQMVMEAVKYAREHQQKILPLCPFAKSVFDKKPEIHDILFH